MEIIPPLPFYLWGQREMSIGRGLKSTWGRGGEGGQHSAVQACIALSGHRKNSPILPADLSSAFPGPPAWPALCQRFFCLQRSPKCFHISVCQAPHHTAKNIFATCKSLLSLTCGIAVYWWVGEPRMPRIYCWLCFLPYGIVPRNVQTSKDPTFLSLGPTHSHASPALWPQGQPLHFHTSAFPSENSRKEGRIQDSLIKESCGGVPLPGKCRLWRSCQFGRRSGLTWRSR